MSETLDVNVLVHATNETSPFHASCNTLVQSLASGPGPVVLLWPVLTSYVRVTTDPRIFAVPLTPQVAMSHVAGLIERPHVRAVGEGDGFWRAFREVSEQVHPRGKLVPDAVIVALMHEHGISTIWTRDRDFRKFDGIRVRDPSSSTR